MKDLNEVIAFAAWVVLATTLYFVFSGEPSLFSLWKESAVRAVQANQVANCAGEKK